MLEALTWLAEARRSSKGVWHLFSFVEICRVACGVCGRKLICDVCGERRGPLQRHGCFWQVGGLINYELKHREWSVVDC